MHSYDYSGYEQGYDDGRRSMATELNSATKRVRKLEEALDSARETLYAAGTFASHTNDTVRRVGQMCLEEFEKFADV
jgi:hypothetical protein